MTQQPPPTPDHRILWLEHAENNGDATAREIISLLCSLQKANQRMTNAMETYRPPPWIISECMEDPNGKGVEFCNSFHSLRTSLYTESAAFELPIRVGCLPSLTTEPAETPFPTKLHHAADTLSV